MERMEDMTFARVCLDRWMAARTLPSAWIPSLSSFSVFFSFLFVGG